MSYKGFTGHFDLAGSFTRRARTLSKFTQTKEPL
jgi:hypothetical protein